jgi:Uncharacterised nucleotidyltransferase
VIDIAPLLLKGAAVLVEGIYPEPPARFLGDIDILIPAQRAEECVAALKSGGFESHATAVMPPPQHHHLPPLRDPETGMGLELHTDVISRSPDAAIATGWFCEHAQPAAFRNHRVLLPEPTRNVAHTIYHSAVFHEYYQLNRVQLRNIVDLALLRARHEPAIDWHELEGRFAAEDLGEMLATYLGFAEALLGPPAPKLRHAPREGALDELRRVESRNSFHVQIERLKEICDRTQTALSHMTMARDMHEADANRLRQVCAALEAERDTLRAERAARDETIAMQAAMATQRDRAADELTRVLASRSWRLTAPLRAILAASRRWRN